MKAVKLTSRFLYSASALTFLALAHNANAALALAIDEINSNRFSATVSGSFDTDVVGDQQFWLAIKPDWIINNGINVPWIADSVGFGTFSTRPGIAIVTDTIAFSGFTSTDRVVAAAGQLFGDAIYYRVNNPSTTGTTVSGTITIAGTGVFNAGSIQTFQLVSGFDNVQVDFERLEASTAVPEPSIIAFLLLGLSAFVVRRPSPTVLSSAQVR